MSGHRYFLIDETERKLCDDPKDYHEALTAEEVLSMALTMDHDYCAYLCPSETVEWDEDGYIVNTNENLEQLDLFLQKRNPNQAAYIVRYEPDGLKIREPDFFRKEAHDTTVNVYPEPGEIPKRLQRGYVIFNDLRDVEMTEEGIGPFYDPKEAETAFTHIVEEPEKYDEATVELADERLDDNSWSVGEECEYYMAGCSDVLAGDENLADIPYLPGYNGYTTDINNPRIMMTGNYTVFASRDEDGYLVETEPDFPETEYSPRFLKDFQDAGERTIEQENRHRQETEVQDYQEKQNQKAQEYAEKLGLNLSTPEWETLVAQSLQAANQQAQQATTRELQNFMDGPDEYAVIRMKRAEGIPDWISREDAADCVSMHIVDTKPDFVSGMGKLFITANTKVGSEEWATPDRGESKEHSYCLVSRHGLRGEHTLRYVAEMQVTESNRNGRVVFVERSGLEPLEGKLTPKEQQAIETGRINPDLFQKKVTAYSKVEIDSKRIKYEKDRKERQAQKEVNRGE